MGAFKRADEGASQITRVRSHVDAFLTFSWQPLREGSVFHESNVLWSRATGTRLGCLGGRKGSCVNLNFTYSDHLVSVVLVTSLICARR